ncbi:MAG TPA: oligosaccharide flippase family protein [Acidobacteriaceae bacterium]|nr:oligosaccharide flippase family protein [Acidobacteriaceae bacterium]
MELRVRHIARNVLFNWFGAIVNMAVGFFLSPFILHRLGDVAYGVWVLAISVVAYLGFLDLGMQTSVLRFVSKGHTVKDHEGASDAISAALWVRLQIAGLALLISGGLAYVFPSLFKIPAELARDAREAILLIGLTTAVTMSLGVMGSVISALNRYDLQNCISLVQSAVRVTGVVMVLRRGHGIVAIAICELIAAITGNLLVILVAHRLYPELRIRLQRPQAETIRKIWSYSSYVFLTTIAVQLVYQTDNFVVGYFVSTTAVTYYAIANNLCRYAGQVISSMANTFTPAASTYEASGNTAGLLMLYKNGTRAMLVVAVPMILTMILRGSSFIGLWVGPKYSHTSGLVLVLLTIPLLFAYANRTAGAISYGMEKHKAQAIWAIGEGIANLILSMILAHFYGLYGVAIGTLIPNLFVQWVFWPGYISKLVGLSRYEVIAKIWLPVIAAAIPFACVTFATEKFYPARSLPIFFLQVIATLPVFFIAVGLLFRTYVRDYILPRIKLLSFLNAG